MKKIDNLELLRVGDWVRIYKREDYRTSLYDSSDEKYRVEEVVEITPDAVYVDKIEEIDENPYLRCPGGQTLIVEQQLEGGKFKITKDKRKMFPVANSSNRKLVILRLSSKEKKELILKNI